MTRLLHPANTRPAALASLLFAATMLAAILPAATASDATVTVHLDITFTLTDLDYQPLAEVPARLVIGDAPGWQEATAGTAFVTGRDGTYRWTTTATIAKRSRKLPTNFVSSLLSRPQPTDFLQVAVQLEYGGRQRRYVVQLHRFPDGTVLQDAFFAFTPDAQGNFTHRAEYRDGVWKLADLDGLVTSLGHDVWQADLQPDATATSGTRWQLDLGLKRAPGPIVR